jgi:hypothetical protein
MVSVGGAVSLQAVQIGVRDTSGDVRTPLANTGGNLLVHVCNALPTVNGITQLVSVGGTVSTQVVQIGHTDGTNVRTPYADASGIQRVSVMDGAIAVTQSGTWTVQPGNTPNTSPWIVAEVPTSTDGLTMNSAVVSAITSGSLLKGAAGKLYSISGFNTAAGALYLRLFNKATAPSSADTPVLRFVIPGNTAGAGFVYNIPPGAAFSTGIGWRISSGLIDSDATANADNQGYVNFMYK